MLDTRFKQHQDAVIGTVLTTLHAGSVLLTFYPNFNLSLQDPNLPTTLKVQVQIQGAEQISSAKIAILHHQLVYRLQNHALDLPTPEHHSDTLMVLTESDQIPTIIQIPRQIPRHELIKLMPLEWISNYEQFHNNTASIQTSESMFERCQDGTVRMTFKPPPSAPQEPPRLSFTYSSMITAVQTAQEDLPITGFTFEGYHVYPAKHNSHFLWDAPGSGMCDPNCPCWDDWEEDDHYATTKKKKPKKKKPPVSCHYYNPLPPPPKPKSKPKPQPRPVTFHPSSITIPGQHSPGPTPASSPVPPPPTESQPPSQSKDKQLMHQFSAYTVAHSSTTDDQTSDSNLAVSDSHTETDTESSVSTSDSEKFYADITRILMAQPDPPPQGQTSHTEPYVDIPSEVEEEMPESSTTNQPPPAQTQTGSTSQKSSNGPWFTFDDLPSHKWRDCLNEMSAWIDLQMLRPGATTQPVLREFATRFTGVLRDWFDSLGRYRQLQFIDLPEVSSALAVLHDQFLGDPSAVFEAARRDYLNMKCCFLNAKDLDFHYKRMSLMFYKLNGFNEPTLKHVFLASLPDELQLDIQRQLTASNLSLDNISLGKIFQLAKTCLDKLCEQKQFFKELLKDKKPFRSACKKPYLQIKCKKKKDCDCSPKKKRHFKKFKNPEFSSRPRRSRFFRKKSSSSRDFKRQKSSRCFICKRKGYYAKDCPNKREKSIRSIPAIGLIDTNAQRSMLNPHILTPDHSIESEEHFKAVNGKLFTTSLITKKPIGIQIFPNCVIWTKFIGSTLPNKDILLGFDIFHQLKHLQIIPTGIRVKSMFKPFTNILRLYNLSETPPSYQDISTKLLSFCPESHIEFTHPTPLWKNESFFIKLPFKLNEDINPTKATHPGMSPSDLLLTQQECSQLLAQGLIEPTNSQWACQAFYVEKHSEIVRGKKCLVIDYQPLNMFLQDDKFPLPRRQSMFTFLKNAQIFSKFDLKSGFWQLGIEPSERYKIAFSRKTYCPRVAPLSRSATFQKASPTVSQHHQLHQRLHPTCGPLHSSPLGFIEKEAPRVESDHTTAVTTFKQIAQNPPPLKLITDGKRILQTDASDESWGAILLEEIHGKEHFIAYASGQFSDTQKHYHSVFKEILAVKNGIKKFEYHFIGHHFLIRMDSSAFPNILNFKGQSYEESFPPLEKQTDTQTRVVSKPFVKSPVTASGQPEEPKQYRAILN
ncbi:hypothetical protein KPL70_014217 [Citrus sinensis]|nr:hypothetical protein KPL70_014217 [Citrus sinensis]